MRSWRPSAGVAVRQQTCVDSIEVNQTITGHFEQVSEVNQKTSVDSIEVNQTIRVHYEQVSEVNQKTSVDSFEVASER